MPDLPVVAALIFALLAVIVFAFQIALVAGARWGHLTMGGRHPGKLDSKGRVAAIFSAILYVPMVAAVLSAAGLGLAWPRWTLWAVVAVMALSSIANAVTPSAPERRLWLPVVLTMLAYTLVVALAGAPALDQVSSASSCSPVQPPALARSTAAS
jgi:hypothetical protein